MIIVGESNAPSRREAMNRAFFVSVCFTLAIIIGPGLLGYVPIGYTPYANAIRQAQPDGASPSLAPGPLNMPLYVPTCVMDTSLHGKRSVNNPPAHDSAPADKADPGPSPETPEVGTYRCQA
jgi:hypothetical protein